MSGLDKSYIVAYGGGTNALMVDKYPTKRP